MLKVEEKYGSILLEAKNMPDFIQDLVGYF